MSYQKGATVQLLLVLAAVSAIWGLVIYLFLAKGFVKQPSSTPPKEPQIQLETQYQNPFNQKTQYVNPFSSYKNPFDNLK